MPPSSAMNESVIAETSKKNLLQGVAKANYARGVAVLKAAQAAPEIGTRFHAIAPPSDELVNSIPAFVDGDGATRYFLPDEITVQFNNNISEATAEQIIKQQGSVVVVKQRTKGYYTIAVPEGSDALRPSTNSISSIL